MLEAFLRSQRKFLENKGLISQFTKMDVKKFKELMKFTLATHADWVKWKKGLFEMSRDYAGIPALWHIAYERLWILEGIRPPPWIRDWLETAMDPGLLTKDEAEIYRLVEATLAELAGKDGNEGGEAEAAAAAAAAEARATVEHMLALTSCPAGTAVGAMRDDNICKLWKVDTKENESDLLTKIYEADQFERLHDRCMVFRQIPKGQPADADSLQVKDLSSRRLLFAISHHSIEFPLHKTPYMSPALLYLHCKP